MSIASDAHGPLDFANLVYGIGQARRGWLEKADVLNTRLLLERPGSDGACESLPERVSRSR